VPEFLSGAWLSAFDRALAAHPSPRLTDLTPLVVEQVVLDVPGRGEVRYRIVAERRRLHLVVPANDDGAPDLRFTTDYGTAVGLARGDTNAQSALAEGKLRLGGDISVLGHRAELFAALEDCGAELRAATTYADPFDGSRT